MEQFNLGYSLKNIPLSNRKCFLKKLIEQTENFIKRLRWRIFWSESRNEFPEDSEEIRNVENNSYGFKSRRTPPQHKLLLDFESDLYNLIGNIKFKNGSNDFLKQMKSDIESLKSGGSVVVEADKTSNLYKMSPEKYKQLLQQNVTKDYKVAPPGIKRDIDKRTNIIAKSLRIEDKMEVYTSSPCFLTLKDHKENFQSNPKCRLINPAKSNLGQVSRSILKRITASVKEETGVNLWTSTGDLTEWFKNLSSLKKGDT